MSEIVHIVFLWDEMLGEEKGGTPPLNPKLMLPKVPFASFWILIY